METNYNVLPLFLHLPHGLDTPHVELGDANSRFATVSSPTLMLPIGTSPIPFAALSQIPATCTQVHPLPLVWCASRKWRPMTFWREGTPHTLRSHSTKNGKGFSDASALGSTPSAHDFVTARCPSWLLTLFCEYTWPPMAAPGGVIMATLVVLLALAVMGANATFVLTTENQTQVEFGGTLWNTHSRWSTFSPRWMTSICHAQGFHPPPLLVTPIQLLSRPFLFSLRFSHSPPQRMLRTSSLKLSQTSRCSTTPHRSSATTQRSWRAR